jgi:hypothetical protein
MIINDFNAQLHFDLLLSAFNNRTIYVHQIFIQINNIFINDSLI